jgi:ATP-dependent RNA helicase CshB
MRKKAKKNIKPGYKKKIERRKQEKRRQARRRENRNKK